MSGVGQADQGSPTFASVAVGLRASAQPTAWLKAGQPTAGRNSLLVVPKEGRGSLHRAVGGQSGSIQIQGQALSRTDVLVLDLVPSLDVIDRDI